MTQPVDLAVVGGGPAGLATALYAARAGLSVTVIEPREGVIDKACGEGLMPPAVASLAALGVEIPTARAFRGIRYVQGDTVAEADFSAGPGLGVRRTVLHAALDARAEALGVQRRSARVRTLSQDDQGVQLDGDGLALRARWVVAADGLRSSMREQLGLALPPRRAPRLGIRRHFRRAPWSDHVEVHWSPVAEAYVTPVADDLVGVAILWFQDRATDLPPADQHPGPFERLLASFPALRAQLDDAAPASHVRGAGPFEQRTSARTAGRVLLVGDASGYLDPLTGEGIRLGLEQAEAAVSAIQAGDPGAYEAAWKHITRRYYLATGGLLALARGRLTRRLIVPACATVPGLMGAAVDSLAA